MCPYCTVQGALPIESESLGPSIRVFSTSPGIPCVARTESHG